MSSKTKIVVLHMKEIIYTGIFLFLGILLLIILLLLFLPGKETSGESAPISTEETVVEPDTAVTGTSLYIPGVYNTELVLNDQTINVEVIVNQSQITSVSLVNLSETVATMYPLLQPTFDSLVEQIYATQSLEEVTYASESKYTSLVLLEAIQKCLDKASH